MTIRDFHPRPALEIGAWLRCRAHFFRSIPLNFAPLPLSASAPLPFRNPQSEIHNGLQPVSSSFKHIQPQRAHSTEVTDA
jgi:hypothetical protein